MTGGGPGTQHRTRPKGGNVIAVEEVPMAEVSSYGVVGRGEGHDGGFRITGMVEKPAAADAPSNLIISGRYILQPDIFAILEKQERGAGGEIQLTDAIRKLIPTSGVEAFRYQGRRYDCGSKMGFLEATVDMGLAHPEFGPQLRAHLRRSLEA